MSGPKSSAPTLIRATAEGDTLLRRPTADDATAEEAQLLGISPRYVLDRCLGGGSFGSVFVARTLDRGETRSPERVAIKVLHGDLPDQARLHVLRRELSSLRAIHCRRIPTVYHADLQASPPYLVMEYFAHGTLESLLAHGPMAADDARALLRCLLEAVVAAHKADVLHLDIKPANVLLDGAGGYVLTDFGISQAPRVTLSLAGLGSTGWQAPEQERADLAHLDLRTDLFGVGATVWSALTGIDLAGPHGRLLRARAATSGVVLPPVSTVVAVDPELESLVMSLLARDPTARPGNAAVPLAQLGGGEGATDDLPGTEVDPDEVLKVVDQIVDPLVAKLFDGEQRGIRRLVPGEALCHQGEVSHYAFTLVRGALRVERDGALLARVDREGEIVGEIAALTGSPRNASLVADGEVYVRVMNAAQLENLVTANPALAVRLIRTMAQRHPG